MSCSLFISSQTCTTKRRDFHCRNKLVQDTKTNSDVMCLYAMLMRGFRRWKTDQQRESYHKHDSKGHHSEDGSHSDMSAVKEPEEKEATNANRDKSL